MHRFVVGHFCVNYNIAKTFGGTLLFTGLAKQVGLPPPGYDSRGYGNRGSHFPGTTALDMVPYIGAPTSRVGQPWIW